MTNANDTSVLEPRRGDTTRLLRIDALLAAGNVPVRRGDTTRLLTIDAVLAATRTMTRRGLQPQG